MKKSRLQGLFERLATIAGTRKAAARVVGISKAIFGRVVKGTYPFEDALAARLKDRLADLSRHAVRPATPVKNHRLGRMWQSMRILPTFTIPDLVATAIVTEGFARQYVRHLLRAGYLRCLVAVPRPGQPRVFMLVRNTGPHSPQLRDGCRTVWDSNLRQAMPAIGKAENG